MLARMRKKTVLVLSCALLVLGAGACSVTPGLEGGIGPIGPQGEPGEAGPPGAKGDAGLQGEQGETGDTGLPGAKGDAGLQGEQGETGDTGLPGAKGDVGIGLPGLPGARGETGAMGEQGEPGIAGEQGPTGPQGPTGEQGPAGPQGPAGTAVRIEEASQGSNTLDTSIAGQTWLSGLSIQVNLIKPSSVVAIASATTDFPTSQSYSFKIGLGTAVADPGISRTFEGNSPTLAPTPFVTRVFGLGVGQHTLHLLAFNQSGAVKIQNATLTLIIVEQ